MQLKFTLPGCSLTSHWLSGGVASSIICCTKVHKERDEKPRAKDSSAHSQPNEGTSGGETSFRARFVKIEMCAVSCQLASNTVGPVWIFQRSRRNYNSSVGLASSLCLFISQVCYLWWHCAFQSWKVRMWIFGEKIALWVPLSE